MSNVDLQSQSAERTLDAVPVANHSSPRMPCSVSEGENEPVPEKISKNVGKEPPGLFVHLRSKVLNSIRNRKDKSTASTYPPKEQTIQSIESFLPAINEFCERCVDFARGYRRAVHDWAHLKNDVRGGDPRTIPQYLEPITKVFSHHISLGNLRTSAQSGCHLCNILDSADKCFPLSYNENTPARYTVNVNIMEDGNHHVGYVTLEAKGYKSDILTIVEGRARSIIPPTLTCSNTQAPRVLQLAGQWLKTCLETHEDCQARARSLQEHSFMPTRLIKVCSTASQVLSAQLVCPKSSPIPGDGYVTLSHCWGGADVLKLTLATIETFQNEIPLNALPKNFLDAFDITVRLGYEFIWIDSLCIVQDSAQDWAFEARSMGDIYQHSICTIAATGAKDSHGGCFSQRPSLSLLPCQLPQADSKMYDIYVEARLSHQSHKPLHSRAWALQERCLSIRTISFSRDQISWECAAAQASEQEPQMQDYLTRDLSRDFYEMLNHSNPTWTLHKWWELISEYTKCDLTFSKDKWPAIQGLALQVSKAWDTSLFYGLWNHRLFEELFWVVTGDRSQRLDIGAPSWSWLSVQSQVYYKWGLWSTENQLYADIRKREDLLTCASLFDEADSPTLEITANFLYLRSDALPTRQTDWYPCHLCTSQFEAATEAENDWNAKWSPDIVSENGWDTYAMQLICFEPIFQAGLVVVPVDRDKNVWKRVGLFEMSWRTEEEWAVYKKRSEENKDEDVGRRMTIKLI